MPGGAGRLHPMRRLCVSGLDAMNAAVGMVRLIGLLALPASSLSSSPRCSEASLRSCCTQYLAGLPISRADRDLTPTPRAGLVSASPHRNRSGGLLLPSTLLVRPPRAEL